MQTLHIQNPTATHSMVKNKDWWFDNLPGSKTRDNWWKTIMSYTGYPSVFRQCRCCMGHIRHPIISPVVRLMQPPLHLAISATSANWAGREEQVKKFLTYPFCCSFARVNRNKGWPRMEVLDLVGATAAVIHSWSDQINTHHHITFSSSLPTVASVGLTGCCTLEVSHSSSEPLEQWRPATKGLYPLALHQRIWLDCKIMNS